jgi:hypothetical protein
MVPPSLEAQDSSGVTHDQGADLVVDGPDDDLLGGFVLGLPDSTSVPCLCVSLVQAVLAPPSRSSLTPLRGAGRGRPTSAFAVPEMLTVLGSDCAT